MAAVSKAMTNPTERVSVRTFEIADTSAQSGLSHHMRTIALQLG